MNYKQFGEEIIDKLCELFPKSKKKDDDKNLSLTINEKLEFCCKPNGAHPKSLYLILYKDNSYVSELDLSLLVEENDCVTWFINQPKNVITLQVIRERLGEIKELEKNYRQLVMQTKEEHGQPTCTMKRGYCLANGATEGEMFFSIISLLIELIKEHGGPQINLTPSLPRDLGNILKKLDQKVSLSLKDSQEDRHLRLQRAPEYPKKIITITTAYQRNPDVVAEVLFKANGKCNKCGSKAPFKRKTDSTPYLEVHHIKPLSKGGKDTVENAEALCPNCHRERHFGPA